MSGETNRLIALAKEIQPAPDPRELDVVASTGEQVTIGLLAMALKQLGLNAKSYTGAPGPGADRQRVHQGAHHRHRGTADPRRPERGHDRAGGGLPGSGRARQHHHARARRLGHLGSGAGGGAARRRVPDLHRRGWGLHDRPAHRARSATPAHDHLRRDARAGEPWLQGAADPVRRVRRQVPRAPARALQPERRRPADRGRGRLRHADHLRGRHQHGTGRHIRHRLFTRRGQDHADARSGSARASRTRSWVRSPRPTSTWT